MSASFHVVETELLRSLVGQLLELVRDRTSTPQGDDPLAAALGFDDEDPTRPTDPVVLRLFPDGYREDDEAANEFRRFTERGIREAKVNAAAAVLASLATADQAQPNQEADSDKVKVHLDGQQATAWLKTLTDLRLALGTRLGVEEGDEAHWDVLPEDDPRRQIHDVYEWLGWVQETLVRALSASLP